jgi:hypothetical protein
LLCSFTHPFRGLWDLPHVVYLINT